MTHRPRLAWLLALALLCPVLPAAVHAGTRLRVVAANLTTTGQKYDPGHGIRIVNALKPDLVLLQECRYKDGTDASVRELAERMCGPGFHVFRESVRGIPNAIFSRWPLRDAGSWDDPVTQDRELAHAVVDLPGPADLLAVSVHLKAGAGDKEKRLAEATRLVELIRENALPYVVVGGDLNTQNVHERCFGALDDVLVIPAEPPADQAGNPGTNRNRSKPYDWVLANPALDARRAAVALAERRHERGLVVDTRVYAPLSDLPGVESGDSDADQMQHMAVVREFLLP